jgi:hypothetical protein
MGSSRGTLWHAVEQMANLRKIGVAVAKTEVNVKKHFGSFLPSG